jgi:hypothetical protein
MTVSRPVRRYLIGALGFVAALWLGWRSVDLNLTRSCIQREWPNLTFCGDPAAQPVDVQAEVLRRRIEVNPGDSAAYVALATLTQAPGGLPGLDGARVISVASQFAPQNSHVMRLRANQALKTGKWVEAVEPLARLSQDRGDAQATRALGQLVGMARTNEPLRAALTAQLKADGRWFDPVVRGMPGAQVPVVLAMPLVIQALPLGLVSPTLGQFLMRELKASGHWVDAQALWIRLWNRPLSLLFNGDFEQGFVSDGFDWEVSAVNASRAGALVSLPVEGRHGRVLQVEFTGRSIAQPVARQHLLLAPGEYVFSGEFMATRLRGNGGLAWTFTCLATGKELARTEALLDTRGKWQAIDLPLKVPVDCGMALALQLQPFVPLDAVTGLHGQVQFDRLELRSR